jgi:biopolymer transport protein TolQ
MIDTLIQPIFSVALWQIIKQTSTFGVIILIAMLLMSIVSWMIIINKYRVFKAVKYDSDKFIEHFKRASSLRDCIGQARASKLSPLSNIFLTGLTELEELNSKRNQGGALQSAQNRLITEDYDMVEMSMERSLTEEVAKLEKQVIFLATTASAAPFMGLMGTVVGIMDSFWSIGQSGSASLAVVAPGIAEALLATIVGLGAAIPAVISYNWANNKLKNINDQAGGFILDFVSKTRKENI